MNDMKKTKEGVNLKKKKFLRLKNTGSILVLMGLLIIFVIALYTFILQSSYTKTALETEIARDTASADADTAVGQLYRLRRTCPRSRPDKYVRRQQFRKHSG